VGDIVTVVMGRMDHFQGGGRGWYRLVVEIVGGRLISFWIEISMGLRKGGSRR